MSFLASVDPFACMCAKLLQSCPILWDPMDSSLPGSSAHGILQTRILEWVAISFPRGSSWPRDQICISYTASRFFANEPPGKSIDPSMCTWRGAYFHWPLVKYCKSPNQALPSIHCGSAGVTSCSQPVIGFDQAPSCPPPGVSTCLVPSIELRVLYASCLLNHFIDKETESKRV